MAKVMGEHLGVAVVDDDPIFRQIVCQTLREISSFVIFEARSGDELVDVLNAQSIDCVVLDYDLGSETGFLVKQRVEELRPDPMPIVMLTGDGRESTAIRAFRMGVADYIPKRNLQPAHLARTIADVVDRSRKERSDQAEKRRLLAASSIDPATGLEGRTRLDERLTLLSAMPAAARSNYALTLVQIVDYEALVERFGFKTSDLALRSIARKMSCLMRSGDVCGRYEGGTFLVILDVRVDAAPLDQICHRLAEELATRLMSDAADIRLVVRVGAAAAAPVAGDIPEPTGGWHPALRWAVSAVDRARASGAAAVVAAEASRTSAAAGDRPALGVEDCPGTAVPRPAAEQLRSEDRRKNPRQRVLRKGLIHLLGTQSTLNCMIRNVSAEGMGLRLEAPCAIPEVFDLEVVGSGTRKRVQLRWQVSRDVGVRVTGAATTDT